MKIETLCKESRTVVAKKFVSGTEPFVLGHYKNNPIYPGVLLTQLVLDASNHLLQVSCGETFRVNRVKRAQFLRKVLPGDVLTIESNISKISDDTYFLNATITVDAEIVMKSKLLCEPNKERI